MRKTDRIYLNFNDPVIKSTCVITGEPIEGAQLLGFFINNKPKMPVCKEIAFEHGFTITPEDFEELKERLFEGLESTSENGVINVRGWGINE